MHYEKVFFNSLSLLLIVAGCNQVESLKNDSPNRVSTKNGRLIFPDSESFKNALTNLSKYSVSTAEYADLGFVSMYQAYMNLTEDDASRIAHGQLSAYPFVFLTDEGTESTAEMATPGSVIPQLVNVYGIVQVGNDLYKFTHDAVISMPYTNESDAETLSAATVGNIPTSAASKEIELVSKQTRSSCTVAYSTGGKNRKVVGNTDLLNYPAANGFGPHAELQSSTKHYKKLLGVWFLESTRQLNIQLRGTLTFDNDPASTVTYSASNGNFYQDNGNSLDVTGVWWDQTITSDGVDATHFTQQVGSNQLTNSCTE